VAAGRGDGNAAPEGRPVKDRRDAWAGRYLRGYGDTWTFDGGAGRTCSPLWWRCGVWVEIRIETAGEALEITSLGFRETRYPLTREGDVLTGDEALSDVFRISRRCQEMCMHETWMDCPYWEQLMYVGDSRVQALLTYVTTLDPAMPRKALRMLDSSRTNATGLTTSNHPADGGQIIPTFSLIWISMIRDFALWRGDPATVRERLPGMRGVLESWLRQVRPDGLAASPRGWNFIDWLEGDAMFPGLDADGLSGTLNWFFGHALADAAALEEAFGEPECAARYGRVLARWQEAMDGTFWDEVRGLYAEEPERAVFSEHSQCLALLHTGPDGPRRARIACGLFGGGSDENLLPSSAYFSHYLFSAAFAAGRGDVVLDRLGAWKEWAAQGLRTPPEHCGRTRSDCHAWSAHPIYHAATGFLGIRPDDWGFAGVRVAPSPAAPARLRVRVPHLRGPIDAAVSDRGDSFRLTLPPGLECELELDGRMERLTGTGKPTERPLRCDAD
jgi:hypothetical protein